MGTTFMNPVITGFNPDPSVARNGDGVFLATSSFEYFPGVPIYHSRGLVNWKLIGHALTRKSQLDMRTVEPGAGIWAPTLRWRKDAGGVNGRFYLATCKWDRYRPKTDERVFPRGFYVYTDNIWDDRAWSEPIYFDNPGFDQDLFWDDDGKVYLSTTTRIADRPKDSKRKDFAIHISEIDLTSGKSLTAPKVIRSSISGIAEGSHIIKRGKYYYLFTAEGGTESMHQVWVLRSENGPLGPWILGPRNPLWYNGQHDEVQNTGHVDVFEDRNGDWFAVLLGVRPRWLNEKLEESPLGRETFLVSVNWTDDWPTFNYGNPISLLTKYDNEEDKRFLQDSNYLTWDADFCKADLELGWYQKSEMTPFWNWVRRPDGIDTPLQPSYSITEKRNFLRLYGNCYNLSSPEAPAMLLRKQTSLSEHFAAKMIFNPSKAGYEAGIVVWWSMHSYASAGITRNAVDGVLYAVFRCQSQEKHIVLRSPLMDYVELDVKSSEEEYALSIADPGKTSYHLQEKVLVSTLIASPPVGGAFTGMMFGLYAFGNGEPCLDPADFQCVYSYRP